MVEYKRAELPLVSKHFRLRNGFSQRMLANKCNISTETYRRFENGSQVSVGTLKSIGDYIGVKVVL